MRRKLVFHCLLAGLLCYAGKIQAVLWTRENIVLTEARKDRLPEETPAAGPGEDDPTPDTFAIKAPPVPKAPPIPKPVPKPQPTPRPKPTPPGATPAPGPQPTPTPPITKPS